MPKDRGYGFRDEQRRTARSSNLLIAFSRAKQIRGIATKPRSSKPSVPRSATKRQPAHRRSENVSDPCTISACKFAKCHRICRSPRTPAFHCDSWQTSAIYTILQVAVVGKCKMQEPSGNRAIDGYCPSVYQFSSTREAQSPCPQMP